MNFARSSREAIPQSSHVQSTWLECEESWQPGVFVSVSQVRPSHKILAKHFVFLFYHFFFTKSLSTLYIPSLLTYCKECFSKKNPRIYTWELEIVIPTIIYTFPCGFPLLLPLHIQILEMLIAQTLTTPNLSVKWGFGVVRKHWKKPIVSRCNRVKLHDTRKLEKTRFREASW